MKALWPLILLAAGLPAAVFGEDIAAPLPADAARAAASSDAAPSAGDEFYCRQRKLGTWFYCDRPKPPASDRSSPATQPAAERLAAIGRQLDELKARAILDPSEENVAAYIRFQREQLDRASTFSDQWQRTIWQNPDLDYTLQRPVSTLGKRAWLDNRSAEEEQALARLSERYGIFYFYAQSCGACDIFAPILKALAEKSGFSVVAVSMDGAAPPLPKRQWSNAATISSSRSTPG